MKKKTRFRLKAIDVIVIFLCLSVCAGSLWFFWKDLNHTTTRIDKKEIATITYKYNISQRKFSDRVVWERLQQNSPLYDADTIRTAALSQATIHFTDGTSIDIFENTMLQLFETEEGVKLSVGEGAVDVDTSKTTGESPVTVELSNGTKAIVNSGSKLTAKSDTATGSADIKIKQGSSSVISKDGTTREVNFGESVKVNDSGKIEKKEITVTSLPENFTVYKARQEEVRPVEIRWQKNEEKKSSSPVVVEISKTKDFSVIEQTYTVEDTSSIKLNLEESKEEIYWRVYEADKKQDVETGKIQIKEIPEVTVLSPKNASEYSYKTEYPEVKFSWNGNEYADFYKLTVSKNQDLSAPVLEKEITAQSFTTDELGDGNYYWQIKPFYSINNYGYEKPAEPVFFSITRNNTILPPQLIIPADNANIFYENNVSKVNFIWKSDVLNASYTLEIARDKAFEIPVYTAQLETTKFNYEAPSDELSAGEYFWRITRDSAEDKNTENRLSETRSFTIAKYVPGVNKIIYPPDNYQVEETKLSKLSFSWKLADEYKGQKVTSILQICPYEDFYSDINEYKSEGLQLSQLKLKQGTYFWRIAIPKLNSDEYSYTEVHKLNILGELEMPVISTPQNKQEIVFKNDGKITVKWTKSPGAKSYNVLVKDSDGQIIAQKTTDQNEITIIAQNKQKYTCTVQAFAGETELSSMRIAKEAKVEFSARKISPVKLVSPENNYKVDGLTALRKPVVLNWKSGEDKPVSSEFILKKFDSKGNAKIVKTIKNPSEQVRLERLTAGRYQWMVKASGENNYVLDSETSLFFTVTDVPLLSKPVLSSPESAFTIGPEYLRKNRNINFKWKAVNGATDYTFVLYHVTENGAYEKISEVKNLKANQYKYSDLTKLDVGSFEWQVIAYSHAKDGFEEQKSKTSVSRFKIQFNMPSKVETVTQEKMYGE